MVKLTAVVMEGRHGFRYDGVRVSPRQSSGKRVVPIASIE